MNIELVKCTYQGMKAYKWVDVNGRTWYFYRSIAAHNAWVYKRNDWYMSSVSFPTLEQARLDLEPFFQEVEA